MGRTNTLSYISQNCHALCFPQSYTEAVCRSLPPTSSRRKFQHAGTA